LYLEKLFENNKMQQVHIKSI